MATWKKSWSKSHAGPAKKRRPKPRASMAFPKGGRWKARQRSRLGQAYRRTAYRLGFGGVGEGGASDVASRGISPSALLLPFVNIVPGRPSPALAVWLKRTGARRYAVITACNPGSVQRDEAENAARQARLAVRLAAHGLRVLPAVNGPDAPDWPAEPSCLVLDPPLALLRRLGRAFGQNALVAGRRDGRPRVVWLGRKERGGRGK